MKLMILALFLISHIAYANSVQEKMIEAAYLGQTAELKHIIDNNDVDINYQDNDGRTVIWYSSYWEYLDTMKLILSQPNINVNLIDNYGIYIYDWIIYEGKWEAVELLRSAGAVQHF